MLKTYYKLRDAAIFLSGELSLSLDSDDVLDMARRGAFRLCFYFSGDVLAEDLLAFFNGHAVAGGLSRVHFQGYLQIPSNVSFAGTAPIVIEKAVLLECIDSVPRIEPNEFGPMGSHRFVRFEEDQSVGIPYTQRYKEFYRSGRFYVDLDEVRIPSADLQSFVGHVRGDQTTAAARSAHHVGVSPIPGGDNEISLGGATATIETGRLTLGVNNKVSIDAYIVRRAWEMYRADASLTRTKIAKNIASELKVGGYSGERGNALSAGTIYKAIPTGLTGGKSRNGRKKRAS
ncbi:hypothetical protein [Paraburkholderia sp. DGU8]|uniref:hypothetical protein n=1 Tax=Paraburkholderia sp. DGU8 TaxID=3161997 RepID=UPI0034679F04